MLDHFRDFVSYRGEWDKIGCGKGLFTHHATVICRHLYILLPNDDA
jgi:hypothetical protein